ncbi:MAG: OmpA family protein [Bacteroidales bacterium]|nr:OmpA family protein [Bacteroidales bacterium]MDD4575005.1 OmpA family protein [Bacteroidales bacterium]
MKKYVILLVSMFLFNVSFSQILDRVIDRAARKAEQRVERKVDNTIDKGLDDVEKTLDGSKTKEKKTKEKNDKKNNEKENIASEKEETGSQEKITDSGKSSKEAPKEKVVVWNKFDFIPGDKVIFEDAPSSSERNGEFPSRWDLKNGQVEIGNVDGENVIMFLDGGEIIPYMENSSKDYLPDVFTIEFDYYSPAGGNRLSFYLKDRKNQVGNGEKDQEFEVTPKRIDAPELGAVEHPSRDYKYCENGCWVHVSLAYTSGKLKVYLDDTRLINIPHYGSNPTGFTIYPYFASASDKKTFYVKNIRIAEGGVPYYDRAMQDGKIVVTGIRFDVGKATLKPESMGPINEILYVLKNSPDLKFSIEGHTDTDGDEAINQKLSEDRAKSVMERLIELGIDKSRLAYKGFGESKPITENNTPEGKAQNRRVEFVKM